MKRVLCLLLSALVVFLPLMDTVAAETGAVSTKEEPTRGQLIPVECYRALRYPPGRVEITGSYERNSYAAYNINLSVLIVGVFDSYYEIEPDGNRVKITLYYKYTAYDSYYSDPITV